MIWEFLLFQNAENNEDEDNWSMAEDMLNELLGDYTAENEAVTEVAPKRSDSTSSRVLTYKRFVV